MIGGKELIWRNITASTNYFDFNAILNSVNDHAAGFMVTYIECDQAMTNVTMTLGSRSDSSNGPGPSDRLRGRRVSAA